MRNDSDVIKRRINYHAHDHSAVHAKMFCCKRSSVKVDNLLPYEYRLYLVNNISTLIEERRLSDAKKRLREVLNYYSISSKLFS